MNQELIKRIESIISKPDATETGIVSQLKAIVREHELINSTETASKTLSIHYARNLENMRQQQSAGLIKTGFDNFDKMFGGFSLGELVVIGARPSMGKTQLLVNLCKNISPSTPIVYFTFDLSGSLLASRFMSALSNIPIEKLVQNNLTDHEKSKLHALEKVSSEHQLFINDNGYTSLSDFKLECVKQIDENGVKVIIVDDLQNMKPSIENKKNRASVSALTNELKRMAKDHNVLMLVASQLNRGVEIRGGDKRPQLADLSGSESIEEDAHKVIFVYCSEYYRITVDEDGRETQGVTELIMAKNTNGKVGTIKLWRDINFRAHP